VQVNARAAEALSDRDSALSQGRYLDALLANYEVFFSIGSRDEAWLRSSGDKLKTDPRVIKLAAALAKHEPAQLPAAADELASLRAETNVRPEIIGLFEGNVRLEMRQINQGEQLLLAAAKKDPYLTSVWHDLADYYYRSFRTPEAWSCMDAARRIAPDHPMLKPLNELEHTLRTKNPEFF
jgi:tetratricopeptide (TPR) repeat protein